jgi:hypothetical protein
VSGGEGEYTPDKIQLIDNSSYVPSLNPTYMALGFLSEYWGRMVFENGEKVETFYPGEKDLVQHFISVLEDIAKAHKITTDIRVEVGPHGHVSVISPELTMYLDSLYSPDFEGAPELTDEHGNKRRFLYGLLGFFKGIDASMFPELLSRRYEPHEVDCRFSYLLGCHIRYGKGNSFELANASHKVKLIIDLLESLGAKRISWSWTVRTAPICHRVEFEPDAVLTRLFGLTPDCYKWK